MKRVHSTVLSSADLKGEGGTGHTNTGSYIFFNIAIFRSCSKKLTYDRGESLSIQCYEQSTVLSIHHVPSSSYTALSYSAIFCEISLIICFLSTIWSLWYCVLFHIPWIIHMHKMIVGLVVTYLVEEQRYKPRGYGSIPDAVTDLILPVALRSAQPLTWVSPGR